MILMMNCLDVRYLHSTMTRCVWCVVTTYTSSLANVMYVCNLVPPCIDYALVCCKSVADSHGVLVYMGAAR